VKYASAFARVSLSLSLSVPAQFYDRFSRPAQFQAVIYKRRFASGLLGSPGFFEENPVTFNNLLSLRKTIASTGSRTTPDAHCDVVFCYREKQYDRQQEGKKIKASDVHGLDLL
jgi:hypothetical protein